jgi:hypothetical protein
MAVQHFDHKQGQDEFSGQGGNQPAEEQIGRLWGISGGFLDLMAVIIQMEAGCWGVVV